MKQVDVDTSKADRQIWLVKVPRFVDKAWREALHRSVQDGVQDLGEVSVGTEEQEGQQTSVFKLKLKQHSDGGDQIPLDYTLMPQSGASTCMHALSTSEQQDVCAIEGKVAHQFVVQPSRGKDGISIDKAYRQISRQRKDKSIVKVPLIQHIQNPSEGSASATPLPVSYVGQKYKREMGVKKSDFKRVKMENKDELVKWLFDLFRRQDHWTFDQIQKETRQPTRFLMDVLRECASKVQDGPNTGLWQLKDKYQIAE